MVSRAGRRTMVAALAIGLAPAVLYGSSSPHDAHGEINGLGLATSRATGQLTAAATFK